MAAHWEKAAHSAYDMLSLYKYLIVYLVFSRLGLWSLKFFLIAPFPYHCLHTIFLKMASDFSWTQTKSATIKHQDFKIKLLSDNS